MQLKLWGLDYFDLFLIHFPIALQYVDPSHRYPPEWWGDDGKSVTLGEYVLFSISESTGLIKFSKKRESLCKKHGPAWKSWLIKALQRISASGNPLPMLILKIFILVSSNCSGSIICDIFRYARIEPQVLQVEIHPYLSQEPLLKFAKTLGIAVTAYSSFGPQSYLELGMDKGVTALFEHDVVTSAASKVGKSKLDSIP